MPNSLNIAPPEPMRILRSALPYLGASMQRQLSLALKCLELQNMLQAPPPASGDGALLRGGQEEGITDPAQNRLEMLKEIRGACDPEHTGYVDTLMQTFRMQSMIQNMPSPTPNTAPADSEPIIPFKRPETSVRRDTALEHTLKSMLNPQQQAVFQSMSGMMRGQMGQGSGAANG